MAVATAHPDVVDSHGATLRMQNFWIGRTTIQDLVLTTTVYTNVFKQANGTIETAAATIPMFVSLKMTVFRTIRATTMTFVYQMRRHAVIHA